MRRGLALVVLGLSAFAQTGKPGDLMQSTFLSSQTVSQTRAAIGGFYNRAPDAPAPRYGVNRYRLRFRTADPSGKTLEAEALLYVPRLPNRASIPLYVMASGTTGLADACATLSEQPAVRNWGNYPAQMLSLAAQGYIALLPNYTHYNDPQRYQTYFMAAYNARLMLDAARAAYRFFQQPALRSSAAQPAQQVFLAGYSQGAHTVFAATDIAAAYAPDLRIVGAIGYGTTTSVEALMRDSPYFSVYVLLAWQQYYSLDPSKVLQPHYARNLAQVAGQRCIDEIPKFYPNAADQLYRSDFRQALESGRLAAYYPALAQRLRENFSGLNPKAQTVPALIVQGGGDPISPDRTVEVYARRLCGLGRPVEYLYLPRVHHYYVRQVGFKGTLEWMRRVAAGERPTNCVRWN